MTRDPDDSADQPGAPAADSTRPATPDTKSSTQDTASGAGEPATGRLPPRRPRSIPPEVNLPAFDERRMYYAELAPYGDVLDAGEIAAMISDGRSIVRANAALAFAAMRQPSPHLVSLLRDSDVRVALAAAEAIGRLGAAGQDLVPAMVQALDATQPQVTEAVLVALSDLVGRANAQLIAALDVPHELAQKTVVAVCGRVGRAGVRLLIEAAAHERSRIRINAVSGLGSVGQADADAAAALLTRLEVHDPVPDIRAAAKKSMLALIAPGKQRVADDVRMDIPDFEERNLAVSELAEHAASIDVDAMIRALQDGRKHVRINASRALGVKAEEAGHAARPLALLLRDSVAHVRREAARALGRLGQAAPAAIITAAPDLVSALGDAESDVAEASSATLAALGERVLDALVRGLETSNEAHGRRVVELIGALPQAAEVLTHEFASPAVNVQVNAALGLGLLGPGRVGPGRKALLGARTGGFARTREAVRQALEMLDDPGQAGPRRVDIDGFETHFLTPEDLAAAALDADAVDDLVAHLQDGRDVVRANAATALGTLGENAVAAARPLGVRLRDDSPRVRKAAAQAIGALGDAAVRETATDLVGALRDGDAGVAEACAAVLRARRQRVLGALLRGLETDDETHARRILAIIHLFDDASDILRDAFENPAVNVQVNAALGLGLLGPERVGAGRKALEGARTGGHARTREAVRRALEMLDARRHAGPAPVQIDGFETRLLDPEAFQQAAGALDPGDLIAHLQDGRAVIRANAATALGVLGAAASQAARPLGVRLRDDDAHVRMAAARALDRLGNDAVRQTADDLVGVLGDADPAVAEAGAVALRARKASMVGALVRGLDTGSELHARRILEIINLLDDASDILCDAFESPAENVQVNAALGLGMLGPKRAGTAGRKALEGARTGGFARTRAAVFRALAMLDGQS